MGDVVHLPVPALSEREWRKAEANIRAGLGKAGVSVDTIDWICADLKPRYLECCIPVDVAVPTECAEQVRKIIDVLSETTAAILIQMIRLELDLWRAKFGGPICA